MDAGKSSLDYALQAGNAPSSDSFHFCRKLDTSCAICWDEKCEFSVDFSTGENHLSGKQSNFPWFLQAKRWQSCYTLEIIVFFPEDTPTRYRFQGSGSEQLQCDWGS